jgi:ArsR family transcriptional regulator
MNKLFIRHLPEELRRVAKIFSALGDPYRQRLVLLFEKDERLNVNQIVEVSSLSRTAVAHHLRVLRDAGILKSEKQGKEVYHWIEPQPVQYALKKVLAYIDRHL